MRTECIYFRQYTYYSISDVSKPYKGKERKGLYVGFQSFFQITKLKYYCVIFLQILESSLTNFKEQYLRI